MMLKIGIIVGSTRPGRISIHVAQKLKEWADSREDAVYEIVNLADYHLPLYNEHIQASQNKKREFDAPEVKPWSEKIDSLDGIVFVSPEYNRGVTSVLKNAIDYLYSEFNNKAAGHRELWYLRWCPLRRGAPRHLGELQVAVVRTHVVMSIYSDFKNFSEFAPMPRHEKSFHT